MPILNDQDNNILLELSLFDGDRIDIQKDRPNTQNWIPFDFVLTVEGEKYKFTEGGIPCFTVWELDRIINSFSEIVHIMKTTHQRDLFEKRFKNFEHTCFEAYFDIQVYDADPDLVGIAIWLNMGYIRCAVYKRGFDFNVELSTFENLTVDLHRELIKIQDKFQ